MVRIRNFSEVFSGIHSSGSTTLRARQTAEWSIGQTMGTFIKQILTKLMNGNTYQDILNPNFFVKIECLVWPLT
jgi:hypothetical protein